MPRFQEASNRNSYFIFGLSLLAGERKNYGSANEPKRTLRLVESRIYIYMYTHTYGRSLLNNPRDFVARKFESATREREKGEESAIEPKFVRP